MSRKKNQKREEQSPIMLLTNERTEFKGKQILMFYQAAAMGQLAYCDGMHPDTDEIVPLLVGLEPTENATQFKVHPLARLLSKHDELQVAYLIPDGQGGWFSTDKHNDGTEDTELDAGADLQLPTLANLVSEEEGPAS